MIATVHWAIANFISNFISSFCRLPQVGANHHSHFGRPLGSHLTGSRFAFRKVLSLQCNWKYIAIAFMLLTMALIIAITYIMSKCRRQFSCTRISVCII